MKCLHNFSLTLGLVVAANLSAEAGALAKTSTLDRGPMQIAQLFNFGQSSEQPAAAPSSKDNAEPPENTEAAQPGTRATSRARNARQDKQRAQGKSNVAQRAPAFPSTAPLPPPRPWGDRDAFSTTDTVASTPAPVPAPLRDHDTKATPDAGRAPSVAAAVAPPLGSTSGSKPAQPTTPDRAVVILVRNNVTRAEDLQGRKVALGPTNASIDELRGVVQANVGVTLDPVAMNWTSGLQGLARGEIDGVLLSVGPKMSPEEVTSVALGSYKLLEIPIQKLAH